jgi:hypothetical protein
VTPERQRVQDTKQLQRLRTLREQKALAKRAAAQRARDAAAQAVHNQEARVAALHDKLARLQHYVSGEGAADLPRLSYYMDARREALFESWERAQSDLYDDKEALMQADAALRDAHAAWTRALSLSQASEELLVTARRDEARGAERRLEREDVCLLAAPRDFSCTSQSTA